MKTFALHNGDIVFGPGGHEMISGTAKLQQDLAFAMAETYRNDRFHPQWGSILPQFIGSAVGKTTQMLVQAEINRIIQNYIKVLNAALLRDAALNNRPKYGPNEVIRSVDKIDVKQEFDRYHVKIVISTLAGQSVELVQSVES